LGICIQRANIARTVQVPLPPSRREALSPQRDRAGPLDDAQALIARGRACYARREWADAFQALSQADRTAPLDVEDLARLTWSAALIGRDDAMLAALERQYQAHVERGEELEAARCAFWLGFRLFSLGERGRASAWLARAERIVERQPNTCAVAGYLLLPRIHQHLAKAEFDAASELAARAAGIAESCREPDLLALARNLRGRALLRAGRIAEGLAWLDEAMLAVTAGELSPLVTGIVYCNVIAGCQQIQAVERSREWTQALSDWCQTQPQLVKFTGACLAHRAEIMQFSGDWAGAALEAQRATVLSEASAAARDAAASGFYQLGEIHRLRGESADAEAAYQRARELGREPQPGLAQLRMAQGEREAAVTTIQRVVDAAQDPLQRIGLLLPCVDILIDAGMLTEAADACAELEQLAERFGTSLLEASARHARGHHWLAEGRPRDALAALTAAGAAWRDLHAPFMTATCRALLARACAALGDHETARLELTAARALFEQLGAKPALAALPALDERASSSASRHGLTARELEVLSLVATGKTNKLIARELALSDKTIERHVSNIFAKLNLASRAAATAYAYQHRLLPVAAPPSPKKAR
jgi:DNA-binding CsgD family transcriptional regulator